MDGFYSIDNFKLCLKHYRTFLERQQSHVDEGVLKDALYRNMMAYKKRSPTTTTALSLREMNNLVLNGVKRDLGDALPLLPPPPPPNRLDERPQSSSSLLGVPPASSAAGAGGPIKVFPVSKMVRDDIDQRYEQILSDRDLEPFRPEEVNFSDDGGGKPAEESFRFAEIDPVVPEDSRLTPSEFARFLAREPDFDPPIVGQLFPEDDVAAEKNRGDVVQAPPTAHSSIQVVGYVSASGSDRDWVTNKHRNRFHVDFQKRFRNVTCFRATCLIVPMEIQERASLIDRPKTHFVHDYGMAYPYLLLQIDGFNDVYDGARKAFAKFVFESGYRAPNGRGYMILRPVQNEAKRFHQAPLASLSAVTLAVQKPNGTLYNNSIDDFGIAHVQYEIFNRMYLKIVTDKFFDRNEFYVGDTILIRGFQLRAEGLETSSRMREFFDRPEGHDVVEMGRANAQGYHNNFYILAPGILDQLNGKVALDQEIIGEIERFNSDGDDELGSEDGRSAGEEEEEEELKRRVKKRINGHVINTSLQNTVTFEVTNVESDTRVLGAVLPY